MASLMHDAMLMHQDRIPEYINDDASLAEHQMQVPTFQMIISTQPHTSPSAQVHVTQLSPVSSSRSAYT